MASRYLFKILMLMQFLIFLMFFVSGIYLLAMAHNPRADVELTGNVTRSGVISILISPLWLVPLIGILRRARWAWWMGLVVNLVSFAILFWAMTYREPEFNWGAMGLPGVFLFILVLHLLSRPKNWTPTGADDSLLFRKAT